MSELSDERLREISETWGKWDGATWMNLEQAEVRELCLIVAELLRRRATPAAGEVEEAIVNYADACMEYEHARENCTTLEANRANDKCEATLAALRVAISSAISSVEAKQTEAVRVAVGEARHDERQKTLEVLGSALRKIAPQEADRIIKVWKLAEMDAQEALGHFLKFLRSVPS